MANEKILSIVLNERPTGEIVPEKTFRDVYVDKPTAADLKDGETLFQPVYLSLDPAARGWLNGQWDKYLLVNVHSGRKLTFQKR